MTAPKPRVVLYDAPDGFTIEVDDLVIQANTPTQVTAEVAARLSDVPGVTIEVGDVGEKPAPEVVKPTLLEQPIDNKGAQPDSKEST